MNRFLVQAVVLAILLALPIAASAGEDAPPPVAEGESSAQTRLSSTMYVPIFMGTYSNVSIPPVTRDELQEELFDGPTTGCGTISEYFDEVSYGNFSLVGTVYDWVTTSETDVYYTQNLSGISNDDEQANTHEFLAEILDYWDPTLDFGQFDNDGDDNLPNSGDDDGYVDLIGFAHPEIDASVGGGEDNMWAHQSVMYFETDDPAADGGVIRIDGYFLHSALRPNGIDPQVIGPFVHEILHGIGLDGRGEGMQDSYDTVIDENKSDCLWDASGGVGAWDPTGAGASATCPPHVNPYYKALAGWLTPSVVAYDLYGWPLLSSTWNPVAMKLWANGQPATEYFLVENRSRDGFNSEIPAAGILIWHVAENDSVVSLNQVAANECMPVLDLECEDQAGPDHVLDADDLDTFDPDVTPAPGNLGDAGDRFCDGDWFNGSSSPSSDAYNGDDTGVEVDGIMFCGELEAFADLVVGVVIWDDELCMRDCAADTCTVPSNCPNFWESPEIYIDNNQDDIIDPPDHDGPNILCTTVRNVGQTYAAPVTVSFYYDDPGLGMRWPPAAPGKKIGEDVIPLLFPGESEKACVTWTIPQPPSNVNHWCIGAIAESPYDAQTSEHPTADNNVAQINLFALHDKAGDAVPGGKQSPSGASKKRDPPYEWLQVLQVCNPFSDPCDFDIRIGSPPLYEDAVIPPDVDVEPQYTSVFLDDYECVSMDLVVVDNDPVHTDFVNVPLTLACGSQPVGGIRLEFQVDNVAPSFSCDGFTAKLTRILTEWTGALHHPERRAVQITWEDSLFDELGYAERVEHWLIFNGATADFEPGSGTLVARAAIDEDTTTPYRDHWVDLPQREGHSWYKIVAVDRAGNKSAPCTTEVQTNLFSPFIFFDNFESGDTSRWTTTWP